MATLAASPAAAQDDAEAPEAAVAVDEGAGTDPVDPPADGDADPAPAGETTDGADEPAGDTPTDNPGTDEPVTEPSAEDDTSGGAPESTDTDGSTDGEAPALPPCPSPSDDADGELLGTSDAPAGSVRAQNDGPDDGADAPTADDGTPCTNLPDDLPRPEGDDDLAGEGPSERPDGEAGDGWVQQPFAPTVVIQELVDAAEAKVAEAEEERIEAIARVRVLRRRLKELEVQRDDLDAAERDAVVELRELTERLQVRLTLAFVLGDNSRLGAPLDNESALRHDAQQHVVQQVVDDDLALITDYRELRDGLSADALEVAARIGIIDDLLEAALTDVDEAELRLQDLELEVLAFSNGAESFISGIRFPIGGPYDVPLIDSWGFPRMTGTADEHWHEGIDIFAPLGSELVATESGTITNIGVGRLGGLKFWLTGDSGTKWYYAHLSDFAEGLSVGQRVEPGDVLGYVGNTGNALGTPYHLHLQMHPGGGDPSNPYPILKAASDWERGARAAAGLSEIPGG